MRAPALQGQVNASVGRRTAAPWLGHACYLLLNRHAPAAPMMPGFALACHHEMADNIIWQAQQRYAGRKLVM